MKVLEHTCECSICGRSYDCEQTPISITLMSIENLILEMGYIEKIGFGTWQVMAGVGQQIDYVIDEDEMSEIVETLAGDGLITPVERVESIEYLGREAEQPTKWEIRFEQ